MRAPITKRKMCEVLLLHFFFGRELRIKHFYKTMHACFTVLFFNVAYGCALNSTTVKHLALMVVGCTSFSDRRA